MADYGSECQGELERLRVEAVAEINGLRNRAERAEAQADTLRAENAQLRQQVAAVPVAELQSYFERWRFALGAYHTEIYEWLSTQPETVQP